MKFETLFFADILLFDIMNALANGINSLALNNDSINMFYGGNLEYFENFEPQPFSGLRLPPYLRWVDCWLYENNYSQDDLQQIQIALSNNWELVEDEFFSSQLDREVLYLLTNNLELVEDSQVMGDKWIPSLRAEDPNEDEGHGWWENGLPSSGDHQDSINDLLEGRFPSKCVCNMCQWGRNIQTDSMHRVLTAHQEAISLLQISMPCKLKLIPYLKLAYFNFVIQSTRIGLLR